MHHLKALIFAAAILPVTVSPSAAGPAKADYIRDVEVSYSDIDLDTEAGARELLSRVEAAAYKACGGDPRRHRSYDLMPKLTRETFEHCRQNAIEAAVERLDAVLVTQLHNKSVKYAAK